MTPIPESVKALTRNRPFVPTAAVSPWPLRCSDGRTFAERAADKKKEVR